MAKKESDFQKKLMDKIETEFPGCVIMKNDASYKQGFPDWIVLYDRHWAIIEAKKSKDAKKQPNQSYYIDMLNDMSYAKFAYPENEEEILNDLRKTFRPNR